VCFVFSSVVFCLNFSCFFFLLLIPGEVFFLYLFIYLDFYKYAGLRVSLA
jgi:hypothetical protein